MDNFIKRVREMINKLNYLDDKKESNLQILKRRIEEIRNRNTRNRNAYGNADS
jgi:hypothetical protein